MNEFRENSHKVKVHKLLLLKVACSNVLQDIREKGRNVFAQGHGHDGLLNRLFPTIWSTSPSAITRSNSKETSIAAYRSYAYWDLPSKSASLLHGAPELKDCIHKTSSQLERFSFPGDRKGPPDLVHRHRNHQQVSAMTPAHVRIKFNGNQREGCRGKSVVCGLRGVGGESFRDNVGVRLERYDRAS